MTMRPDEDAEGVPIDPPDVVMEPSAAEQAWLARQARRRVNGQSKFVPHQGAREKARRQTQRLQPLVTPELRRWGFMVKDGGIVWKCADCGAVVPEMAAVPDTPCCQARLKAWRASRDEVLA